MRPASGPPPLFPPSWARARRRLWLCFALLASGCTGTCTPDLDASDVEPYQGCSADSDCAITRLNCTGCTEVAVATDKLRDFEGLRGCWPSKDGASDCFTDRACEESKCVRRRCQIVSGASACGVLTFDPDAGSAP